MRCVFFVKRYWPACGGVERYVTELSRALVARGHRVSVVAGAHAAGLPSREKVAGVAVHRFSAQRSSLRCLVELRRLRGVFGQADVVHVSDAEMLDYFWRMLGWQVTPQRLSMTVHGMSCVHPVPEREITRAGRARRLVDVMVHDGAFIGKWVGVKTDAIIAQGLRPTADEIVQRSEPSDASAVYVGRLEPDTGVELYFDALAVLRDRWNIALPLDVYGDGGMRRVLEQRAEAQNLRVAFHGAVADAQERIGAYTLAFVSGRMAIHEALARRRPVIAAYTNPIRADYVRGESFSPFIATGGSGAELAAHAQRLLADPYLRGDVAERGWQHVRELSWEKTADAYLNLWLTHAPARTRPQGWMDRVQFARKLWREVEPGRSMTPAGT